MPEIKPRKKKTTYTLPPDVEEYLRGAGRPKFGGAEWGGEGLPEEWSNLSPQAIYDYVAQNDPYTLYQIQLMDLFLRAKGIGGETEPGTWPEQGVQGVSSEISGKSDTQFQKVIDEAELKIKMGYPVESLPFYEESKGAVGPNFWREYNSAVDAEVLVLAQEQEQVEQARQKLFDPYNLRSEGGRHNLLSAVNQGLATQEEADRALSKQWDWQNKQTPDSGAATNAQIAQTKQNQARQGFEAQQAQQLQQSQLMKFLFPDLFEQYRAGLAKGWGMDKGGGPGRIDYTAEEAAGDQLLVGKSTAPGSYVPPSFYEQGFSSWMDTDPGAQKAQADYMTRMSAENPLVFPAYLDYVLSGKHEGGLPKTMEAWQQEDVTGRMLREQEEQRRAAQIRSAKARLTPLARMR